jgi:hypothetical protein
MLKRFRGLPIPVIYPMKSDISQKEAIRKKKS